MNYMKTFQNNLTGFLVVRHPFERLVSAYRDKLERRNLEEPYYYVKYGNFFVKRYREKAIKVLGKEYFDKTNNFGTPLKVANNLRPNSDLPTFWEFVEAVTERYKLDEHWSPINEHCSICNQTSLKTFRFILKFEQMMQRKLALPENFQFKLQKDDHDKSQLIESDRGFDQEKTSFGGFCKPKCETK